MIHKLARFLFFMMSFSSSLHAQLDSIVFYKEQIKMSKSLPDFNPKNIQYINLLNKLSTKLKHYKTDTMGILSKEALTLSRDMNYNKGKNDALANLAIYELIDGDFEKSLSYNREILTNIDTDKNPELAAGIYNIMGQTYFSLDNYPESYKHFYQSLLLAEKANSIDLVVKINSNLGTLFSLLEDYDEAAKYYEVAIDNMDEDDNSVYKAGVQCNLGYLYMKKKDSTKAITFLRKSLPTLEKQQITGILPIVYLTFGEVYYDYGNYKKSLAYFNKALPYYETLNDARNNGTVLYGIGTCYLALNNLQKSEQFLEEGIQLFKKVNYKTGLEQSYQALYQLHKTKESFNTALYWLELSESYKDSIFKEKSVRDISMLKAKMAFEEDQAELKLKNDLEIAEQKKYIKWAGLGIGCAILIAILVFKVNNKERKLNKELALQTRNLSKKQEELNKINHNQDKLFSIVGHDLRGPIVSLKQLLELALEDESGIQHFYRFGPKLKKDVDHIHFTLDNLLNWGITQMKGEPVLPVQINVKTELLLVEELFRDMLDKKSIIVDKELLYDMTLIADANHFKIIFRNLVSNAIKFTPKTGRIWLATSEEDENILITVKDNGIGISDEVIEQIFNRSDYHTTFGTNNERGTGLGLMLCKEMVHKNKGEIWVESTVRKGSIFYVKFPKAILA